MRQVDEIVESTNGNGANGRAAHPVPSGLGELGEIAANAGLRRIQMMAWRDLDDPEAGGSEVYASTIARLWADAGIDVTMLTSAAPGHPQLVGRDGYRVIRRFGRYSVFPRMAIAGAFGRPSRPDGLIEIWNGMPFFSPLWAWCPKVVFLHHVHAEMWDMALTQASLARVGKLIEFQAAPPLYRGSRIVTLSSSSRREIVERLRLPPTNISVVPPGVHPRFSPGDKRSDHPLVVAVGRLVPVKRFDVLIDALIQVRRRHPDLMAVIVGEGYERPALEARVAAAGANDWLSLPGRLSDDDLVRLYRQAWLAVATSLREGWGMTLTEAAACGTPAVATAITGHVDAVIDGASGLLVDEGPNLHRQLVTAIEAVLGDRGLRQRLAAGALARTQGLTWEATAKGALAELAAEARRARRSASSPAALGPPTGGLGLAVPAAGDRQG
jgi:glycosyltransferase involved in cell wall biosynthesis